MIDLSLAPPQRPERYCPTEMPPDPVQAFRDVLASHGIKVDSIDTSGNLTRVDVDRPGDKAGWYVFNLGEVSAGAYGNWKTDLKENWCSKDRREMTNAESANYSYLAAEAKRQREAIKIELQAAAKVKAHDIWADSDPVFVHPYLTKKGVQSSGLKQSRGKLIVPLFDEKGELHNLQFISSDGSVKKFLFGGRIEGLSFTIPGNEQLAICEGYSTGATINQATGVTVICAMNRVNLTPVAKVVRSKCPNAQITICADNDRFTAGNPGIADATLAAKAISAKMVFPVFDGLAGADDPTIKLSDFNDLAAVGGIELVSQQLTAPAQVEDALKGNAPGNILQKALFLMADFRKIEVPPKVYHLFPWSWRGAYIIVAGARGVGKTWFVLAMVDAITRGVQFGPWPCNEPVSCLVVEGELAMSDDQERIDLMNLSSDRKEPLYILSDAYVCEVLKIPSLNIGKQETRDCLRDLVLRNNIKVIVLDNIASLTPGIDENSKLEWDDINQWAIGLRYAGVSVVMVHHLGKNGEQRGTSGREDNVDMSVKLLWPRSYQTTDGARFVVSFPKKRVPHKLLPFLADLEMQCRPDENGKYAWVCAPVAKNTKLVVLDLLSKNDSQNHVAVLAGISKSQVSKLKAKFINEGLLDSFGVLTPKGKNELEKGGFDS